MLKNNISPRNRCMTTWKTCLMGGGPIKVEKIGV